MSDTDLSPQTRMANDIAVQFTHQPPDQAAAAIANHIKMFWDPRMKSELDGILRNHPDSLHPLAREAAQLLHPDP
ncbi:formate dehydrogenase subunit delta [Saccharopolyspora griseoalba]|uniref:Formate dehydrogenase subunit delta n=1 Tax=Saccharopolyspora griseoalba TaxID=1431848 RepID=A0ABW2LJW7_9PSEU